MKKILILMSFLSLTHCAQIPIQTMRRDVSSDASNETDDAFKKRVIMLPFRLESSAVQPHLVAGAKLQLQEQLALSKKVIIVSADELKIPLLDSDGVPYPAEKFTAKAREMGIPAVLEATILEISTRKGGERVGILRNSAKEIQARVRIRLLAASSGQPIFDREETGTIRKEQIKFFQSAESDQFDEEAPESLSELLGDIMVRMAPEIVASLNKVSWEGRIALIQGDRIYVNAGQVSGLKPGDLLRVSEPGQDIFDPDTGSLIGRAPGRLKGTLEVVSYFGKDGSINLIHSGSGFQENDLVELY